MRTEQHLTCGNDTSPTTTRPDLADYDLTVVYARPNSVQSCPVKSAC